MLLFLGVVGVVLLVVFAGLIDTPGKSRVSTDRLGPEQGERVSTYLERAQASLTGSEQSRIALVSFDTEVAPAQAYDMLGGVRIGEVLFQVPIPDVATRLVVIQVGDSREAVLDSSEIAAAELNRFAGRSGPERQQRVDDVSAQRLAAGCACVVGVTVRATPSKLTEIAAREGVRAVEALPADAIAGAYALVPLLPEQTEVVLPLPDDGAVPAA
ncbi:hypothetical protein JGU72_00770 [Antrihabitans sp. YC2-6]|nr:hypothetical protein [Antrihabitans sp. YC2-6]